MHDPRPALRPTPPRAAPDPAQLWALLAEGDLDAALDAGLMALDMEAATTALDQASRALLAQAQQRLRAAWDARERYRARAARLARRAAGREARGRTAAPATSTGTPLPASAAAALARAKARAQRP